MSIRGSKRIVFHAQHRARGFSLAELLVVLGVALVVAAIAIPGFSQVYYNVRLRAAASDLEGLMQQARITAERKNQICPILYRTSGVQDAYIDLNLDGAFENTEPLISFRPGVSVAASAPSGSGGQPSAYVLAGDTGTGSFSNGSTLGFSARGLPCDYSAPPTCTTPAAKYFVYYLTDQRPGNTGWAGVVVSKSGRTKIDVWNGTTWQ